MPVRTPPAFAAETANDRFKRRSVVVSSNGLIVAVAIHFAAFALFPRMTAADIGVVTPDDLKIIAPPPPPDIPDEPQRIDRPAAPIPVVGAPPDETIGITDPLEAPRATELAPPAPRQPDPDEEPFLVPMTTAPQLLNRADVERALTRRYPPLLREAGIGGTAHVWFFIDEEGTVLRTRINEPSGYEALDEAALEVATIMRFSPAKNRNDRVRVWVSVPIRFQVRTPE